MLTMLHQYVPLHEVQLTTSEVDAHVNGPAMTELLHKMLFSGDLLTAIQAMWTRLYGKMPPTRSSYWNLS